MDLKISGKTAMVAAASKGIGFATAKLLIQEGAQVSICGRGEVSLKKAVSELGSRARYTVCDISKTADIQNWFNETLKAFKTVDILVTNTGGPPVGTPDELTDELWIEGFNNTVLNIVRMVRFVVPVMKEKKFGRIIHITSLVARQPQALITISSTLRAGINALTRIQAKEYGAHGITVNAILPGHTLTDRQLHLVEVRAKKENTTEAAVLESTAQHIPVKRLAVASEIAAQIVFLASENAGFITGTDILVDGGSVSGV